MEYITSAVAMNGLMTIGVILVLALIGFAIFDPRKSWKYRKLLADMFIAGRIKQIAKEKDINISHEVSDFKKWCKEQRITEQDVDDTIRTELQEEIAKVNAQDFIDKV